MLIPRITDFSDAGVFAVAISICSILNYIATLFMNQYQVSDQYEKFSENDYFVCRLITIIVSFAVCIIVVPIFNYSLEQSLTIIGYMLYRNLLHFAYLHMATLQIEERLDLAGKCMIIEGAVSFVSFTTCYYATADLPLSVFVMAIFGGGSFLLTMAFAYRRVLGRHYPYKLKNLRVIVPMTVVGVPLLLSVMAPAMITALPKLILQMYQSDEAVGIFSTLTAPTIIIPTLVTGVFTPFIVHFSNLRRNNDLHSIRRDFAKTIVLIAIFSVFAVTASLLLAEFFFTLLYGEGIAPYVHYFHIMVIGISIFSIGLCGITVLITKDQGKEAAIYSVIALAISMGIFSLTIPLYGMNAATYGLLASYSIFSILITLSVWFKPLKTNPAPHP